MELCLSLQGFSWETTKEVIEIFASVVGSIAGLWAVCIARRGLNTWKSQLAGTAKYELARNFIRSVFEYRDRFNDVRYPSLLSYEMQSMDSAANLPKRDYSLRWDALGKAKTKMEETVFECKTVFLFEKNEEVDSLLKEFAECQLELYTALEEYFDWSHQEKVTRPDELTSKVYKSADSGKDKLGEQLNAIVKKAEALVSPVFKE